MKLLRPDEIGRSGPHDTVFRTSALRDVIVMVVCGLVLGAGVAWYVGAGEPSPWWADIGLIWIAFWLGVIVWLAWLRFRAAVRSTNWLLRCGPDGVLVKFRSFQNDHYPEVHRIVIALDWCDIHRVRKVKERSMKTGSDGALIEFFTCLDLLLHMNETERSELAAALREERTRSPLRSSAALLKSELFQARKRKAAKDEISVIKARLKKAGASHKIIKSSGKYHDYPVRLLDGNVLRIRWNAVRPGIDAAIAILGHRAGTEPQLDLLTDTTDSAVTDDNLDDLILDRVMKGDTSDAVALLKRHRDFSTTAAMHFIDELTGREK